MTTPARFQPVESARALLNLVYEVKFSRHVPLTVILLSAAYAVYRSMHYLKATFHLGIWIALPTALFIELLILGCGALVFITFRDAYVAELRNEDQDIARIGAWGSLTLLGFGLAALLSIAAADAWLMTEDAGAAAIMTLIQIGQSGMILIFVVTALLDERAKLRDQYADYRRGVCRWCGAPITPNNRARHENACPQRPQP